MENYAHKLHRDHQFYDEVHITTIPRWKESEISGDEWRFSARVEIKYKGVEILRFTMLNVKTALEHANTMIVLKSENAELDSNIRSEIIRTSCDQEGCNAPATHFFEMGKQYRNDGSVIDNTYFSERLYVAKFCQRHQVRGDCGLEDADTNYQSIEDPRAS